ncbi:MAG TPA: glycine--tRNA ligase subunit beta, partial [Bryobacteraceae bacterium]|nr:glycine--tRNA ligase subunit beta [Bryobacteraceae bacterium]
MSLPFLLEIGCEEIPDWMIVPALNHLQQLFQGMLEEKKLPGRVVGVDATPRRLVLKAEDVAERQMDSEELITGPPKSAGPGAAAGFAKKLGTTPEALSVEVTPKGEYLSFRKKVPGRETVAILAEALPTLIPRISFPKTMYWIGKGAVRFIRPIRWILALLGDNVVPFELAGVKSGKVTSGHRRL